MLVRVPGSDEPVPEGAQAGGDHRCDHAPVRGEEAEGFVEDLLALGNVIQAGDEGDRVEGGVLERKLARVLDDEVDVSPLDDVDPDPDAMRSDEPIVAAAECRSRAPGRA